MLAMLETCTRYESDREHDLGVNSSNVDNFKIFCYGIIDVCKVEQFLTHYSTACTKKRKVWA